MLLVASFCGIDLPALVCSGVMFLGSCEKGFSCWASFQFWQSSLFPCRKHLLYLSLELSFLFRKKRCEQIGKEDAINYSNSHACTYPRLLLLLANTGSSKFDMQREPKTRGNCSLFLPSILLFRLFAAKKRSRNTSASSIFMRDRQLRESKKHEIWGTLDVF